MELTFGEQIKIILKRKNMTIRQLAELVEVQTGKPMSRQNLTQKLNRDNFQEQDMKEIAQALGCVVKISVTDPVEAALAPQNVASPQSIVGEALQAGSPEGEKRQGDIPAAEKSRSLAAGKHSVGRLRVGRPGGHPEETEQELAKREAAVTKQPMPEETEEGGGGEFLSGGGTSDKREDPNADILKEIELALMESIQREMNPEKNSDKTEKGQIKEEKPEADTLAWARQKPSVWPTLTVPRRVPETMGPPLPDELLIDAGNLADVKAPSDAGVLVESSLEEDSLAEADRPLEDEPVEEAGVFEEELSVENEPLPFEAEEPLLEEVPLEEVEDLEDLEFFDLEDFDEEEIFQVSAPYVMKRENLEEQKRVEEQEKKEEKEKRPEKAKLLRKEKPLKEKKLFLQEEMAQKEEPLSDTSGDISFASAPYVISREPEVKGEQTERTEEKGSQEVLTEKSLPEESLKKEFPEAAKLTKEMTEKPETEEKQPSGQKELPEEMEEDEELQKGFRPFGRLSGSPRGDISSVSAPYVIPRKPEDQPIRKWEDQEFSGEGSSEDMEEENGQEQLEEPEEVEPLSTDMEEKIASWDAAVKRQLANPFRSFEGRRIRRMAKMQSRMEPAESKNPEPDSRAGEENLTEPARSGKVQTDRQTGVKEKAESEGQPETNGQAETEHSAAGAEPDRNPEASKSQDKKERPEEPETVDLQGPAFDPVTGAEYETNTVKHHPFKPDMLLVYDQDEHRWIVQSERAFLNFQINKRALLGKDYEPPVYLD